MQDKMPNVIIKIGSQEVEARVEAEVSRKGETTLNVKGEILTRATSRKPWTAPMLR